MKRDRDPVAGLRFQRLGAAPQAGGGAAWLQRGDVVAGVVGCRREPWALEARLAHGWPLLESAWPAVWCAHQLRARATPRDAPQALRHRLTWVLGAACGACGRAAVRCGGVERPAAPLRPDARPPSPPQTHPVDDGPRLRAQPPSATNPQPWAYVWRGLAGGACAAALRDVDEGHAGPPAARHDRGPRRPHRDRYVCTQQRPCKPRAWINKWLREA